jgi:penicillin-binding protein 1B
MRQALQKSLNIPTIRLALATGLERIDLLAHEMGIDSPTAPHPTLALGAVDASPLEAVTLYGTLASGGIWSRPYGLRVVQDGAGAETAGAPLEHARVLDERIAQQVTWLLRGVVDHGTGAGARRLGLLDPVAGKTGTSSDRRDSWFAGYSHDRVTVAWVGYDDNRETRLSGARAALPIWTRFMLAVRPAGGYPDPAGFPEDDETWTTDCPEPLRSSPVWDALPFSVDLPELPDAAVPSMMLTRELAAQMVAWGGSAAAIAGWERLLEQPWPATELEIVTLASRELNPLRKGG